MKSYKLTFFIVLMSLMASTSFSQVGIGTTSPDSSSILELNSTTQGVLTPRMTTAQRTGIATPAEGLLVYDTELDGFYYWDTGVWNRLSSGEKRDNYKLIKSDADLADELTAGGGVEYLLDSNTLYEINGTISLGAPINLNDAYINGEDTNSDILLRVGGTIFTGVKGGSIRGLTLVAPSGTVFNMTGTGVENLIFRDCIVANSGNVGSLSTFNLVFISIINFVNNTNGLTYTDIHQLLLNQEGWDDTNQGIYETFVGSFDVLGKQGGYSDVTTATAGVDITGITTLLSGGLTGVNFQGGGNYVNGTSPYTGYNFPNEWNVNSPGIFVETDNNAKGDFSLDVAVGSGFTTSFTGTGAASRTKISGTTIGNNLFRFVSGGNNRLIYDGTETRYFKVNVSISFQGNTNNDVFIFYIAKGNSGDPTATVDVSTKAYREAGSNFDIGPVAVLGSILLEPGDFLEVWAERWNGSGDIVVVSMNMVAD